MDSALLPHSDSGDEETISIVAYGTTPPSSEAPHSTNENHNSWRGSPSDVQTSYQPPDWASDVGAVVDGSARRIAVNAATDTNSSGNTSSPVTPPLSVGNSFRKTMPDPTASVKSSELPTTPPANTTVHPLTLYGKDILHIIPFGTTSQDANPVKWSDTLGVVDTEDEFSIRDPHFDLTNGKITKLFSLSNPDGTWQVLNLIS